MSKHGTSRSEDSNDGSPFPRSTLNARDRIPGVMTIQYSIYCILLCSLCIAGFISQGLQIDPQLVPLSCKMTAFQAQHPGLHGDVMVGSASIQQESPHARIVALVPLTYPSFLGAKPASKVLGKGELHGIESDLAIGSQKDSAAPLHYAAREYSGPGEFFEFFDCLGVKGTGFQLFWAQTCSPKCCTSAGMSLFALA